MLNNTSSNTTQRVVIKDDIIFVNNGAATTNGIQSGNDTTGTGTAEKPKATLQPGANLAMTNSNSSGKVWNVYTQGTATPYTGAINGDINITTGSVNFIGSGQLISAQGGKTFGTGPAPTVTGGFLVSNIQSFGIHGYQINTGSATNLNAITLTNVANVEIEKNIISNVSEGISLQNTDSTNTIASITGNQISNAFYGIFMFMGDSSTLTATLQGNTLQSTTSHSVYATVTDSAQVSLTATNNTIASSGGDGFALNTLSGSQMFASLSGNVITAPAFDGVGASASNSSTFTLLADNNTITTPGNSGFDLVNQANGTPTFSAQLTHNTISGAQVDGITGTALSGSYSMTANNNTITNSSGNGINLLAESTTAFNANIGSNTITHPGSSGITVEEEGTSNVNDTTTITNNTITNAGIEGIGVVAGNISSATFSVGITGNTVQSAGFYGILISGGLSSNLTVVASNNQILTSPIGIGITGSNSANLTATLTGNLIDHASSFGIYTTASGTSIVAVTATGNTITAPGYGIYLQSNTSSSSTGVTADLENNTISNAVLYGIWGQIVNGSDGITAKGNTINTTGSDAINISTSSNLAIVNVALTNNTITSAGGNGVVLTDSNTLASEMAATIDGNTITGSALDGINIQFHNAGFGVLSNISSSVNNEVTGSGGLSLDVLLTPHVPSNIILNGTNISPPATTP